MHVRLKLKHINKIRKVLADGTVKEYAYLGRKRGAIPLCNDSREALAASYQEAEKRKLSPRDDVLSGLLTKFENSAEFKKRAERTRTDYKRQFRIIEKEFGDLSLDLVPDARGMFKEWRDEIAERSLRQADYAWVALQCALSWALDRNYIKSNPCTKGGRLYDGNRRDKVWTPEQEATFLAGASAPLCLAFLLALHTGQRQGDLLALTWFAYDGAHIRLKQSKTGVRVTIRIDEPLKPLLDAKRGRADEHVLLNSDGKPWTADGFSSSWRKTCKRLGISGVTFHDCRGSFVTRSFADGGTEAEIATVTGLSLRAVRSILDAHYFHRDPALVESLFDKRKNANRAANRPVLVAAEGAKT